MSIFNDDRSSLNPAGAAFDAELSSLGFDAALQKAFDSGMNLDEILYIVISHSERIINGSVVRHQLKMKATKK